MMDKAIKRVRRVVYWTLNTTLGLVWFVLGIGLLAEQEAGPVDWWRLGPSVALVAVFSVLFFRVTRAILDRRYAQRELVAGAGIAVVVAVLGTGAPTSWSFVSFAWLSVASVGVRARTAWIMAVSTLVVMWPLNAYRLIEFTAETDPATRAGIVVGSFLYTALMCGTLPWANRLWVWIWHIAEEAHEGREAQARLAVAEERLRFARDLHDLVGHQLSAIAVKSELAVRLGGDSPASAEMAEVRGLARTALRELREAVKGYRQLDLAAELASVRGVLEAAGITCDLKLPYRDAPGETAPVFAWVVREAVTNVLRHSTATTCEITLRLTPEETILEVRNNGVQKDAVKNGEGSGLAGLAERLGAVGGKLTAEPDRKGGFVLRAVAPTAKEPALAGRP
ncbi:sensor histidine kinase [Herbidospora sp. NBRC 101105]|uniref:sensor histidine kinase n=1 Tax=Herbidospora sp. NBRC 101105 TaxID=3032195 RepID=UPI002553E65A|nr:sensor histidine kinase [Herbidospora sp. NBRC 101105]